MTYERCEQLDSILGAFEITKLSPRGSRVIEWPYGQAALALTPLDLLDRLPALISLPWRHRLESAFPLQTILPVKVP